MKCLVTGGGGFLGLAVVKQLLDRGHSVRTFQRGRYAALDALDVESVQGIWWMLAAITAAAKNVDVVLHVAAKPTACGDVCDDFYLPNVVGDRKYREGVPGGGRAAG